MSGPINAQALLAGNVAASTDADNATATATVAATEGARHFALGVSADFSAAVSAIKTITIKRGSTTLLVVRWDFANGPAILPLPGLLHGDHNEAISAELAASGSGGTTGRVYLFYFSQ